MDVRGFGSWISAPKCLFFQNLSALTEVLGRDIRANDPRMSAGYPARKLREAKPGCFQTWGFPLFSGKVQIVSRTLSGLFLVGALNRLGKRKRTNRENPRTIPVQIGKIPGKVPKGQKRTKKEGQVQIGKPPPRLKHPRLAALKKTSSLG